MKKAPILPRFAALVLCILLLLSGCGNQASITLTDSEKLTLSYVLDDSFIYMTANNSDRNAADTSNSRTYSIYRCYFDDGRQVSLGEWNIPNLGAENITIIQDTLYFLCYYRAYWYDDGSICKLYAIDLATNEIRLVYADSEPRVQACRQLYAINGQLWVCSTSRVNNPVWDLEITILDPATGQTEQTLQYINDDFSPSPTPYILNDLDGFIYLVGVSTDGSPQLLKLNRQLELEAEIDLSAMEAEMEVINSIQLLGEELVLCKRSDAGMYAPAKDMVGYLDGNRLVPVSEIKNAAYQYSGYPLFYSIKHITDPTFNIFSYNDSTHTLDEMVVQLDLEDGYSFRRIHVSEDNVLFVFDRYNENPNAGQPGTVDYQFCWTDRNFTGLKILPSD